MDERAERIGKNEAIFREVNEEVESLNRGMAEVSDNQMHIVCECGDLVCVDRLVVPMRKYEEIRSDSALFFIRPGHDKPEVEDVVEQVETYAVVRKRPGGPAEIAEDLDPRS